MPNSLEELTNDEFTAEFFRRGLGDLSTVPASELAKELSRRRTKRPMVDAARIIAELAAGLTIPTIAAKLHISRRTVDRIIAKENKSSV